MTTKTVILQSARIAELRTSANQTAALCKRQAPIFLPISSRARYRCLLLLLRHERWRNEKLVELIANG
jgi:hypothetical protein